MARVDQRVRRSRDALGDALVELIQEKTFDSITVQDVLDRAGVGRSTFYAHYKDKNDLWLSDVEEFLEMMAGALSRGRAKSERVFPVNELFTHVADQGKLLDALSESGRLHDFLELAQGCFARGIERRLGEVERSKHLPQELRTAMGQALAGALLSLLRSWMAQSSRKSAKEMDVLFHQLVFCGVQKL